MHAHKNLSVVVLIVHELGISTLKYKRQSPVAADSAGKGTLSVLPMVALAKRNSGESSSIR